MAKEHQGTDWTCQRTVRTLILQILKSDLFVQIMLSIYAILVAIVTRFSFLLHLRVAVGVEREDGKLEILPHVHHDTSTHLLALLYDSAQRHYCNIHIHAQTVCLLTKWPQ